VPAPPAALLDLLVDGGKGQDRREYRIGFRQRFALWVELGRMGGRIDRRARVEQVLEALGAPGEDEDGQDDPRHPRAHHRWLGIAGKGRGRLGLVSCSVSIFELSTRPDRAAEVCTVAGFQTFRKAVRQAMEISAAITSTSMGP
jgi:hypothetical protein